jgi:biopolymer transport protein ExbD
MAKRRHAAKDEILMVPFLDILCSLIGVLVLIIVVLTVSQVQQTEGRTEEEMERSKKYQELKKLQKLKDTDSSKTKDLLVELQKLEAEQKEKEERLAKIRKLLSTSADVMKQNETMGQTLIKELDNLLLEIEGLKTQIEESTAEVAALAAELKEKQIPPDKKPPPVVVQPSGSGSSNDKLFFIETSGAKLVFKVGDKQETVAATEATIIASAPLNHFLAQIARERDTAQLVFLLRSDGTAAYTRAGGWAQNQYNLRISRMLVPGQGTIDTKLFGDCEGKVPPLDPSAPPPTPPQPK